MYAYRYECINVGTYVCMNVCEYVRKQVGK